ncbi:MAG: cation diffusion facilitator family transporter [Rickettsiales bacterium]|jgi:cobalt-zinc-cadmium efflux system protein|nr:cation diffusion facilitator family transporter [Rickettsiales bacterium]
MKKEKHDGGCNHNHINNNIHHSHTHTHDHNHEMNEKGIKMLYLAFGINMFLSLVEIISGIFSGSISLIGDGLHNTSDAFSILIAIIAYKIGTKKTNKEYSFGYKRSETIGGFINLILLFISGGYLFFEGLIKFFNPEIIKGEVVVITSIIALIIDVATAKISHQCSGHNANMKMLFLHNLADALGSIGVIISGIFVMYFDWYFVDGLIAIILAIYMITQSIYSFSGIVRILMNAMPENFDYNLIKNSILKIKGVKNVHHLHIWNISENELSLEGHVVGDNLKIVPQITKMLEKQFSIRHVNIQIESKRCEKYECAVV